MGKFEMYIDKSGESRFRLKAGNGEIILVSEGYSSKAGCKNGIASVQKNCVDDDNYERLASKNGQTYFNLKAGNGEVIGESELYKSEAGMENGIASIKKNGVTTTINEVE